MSLQQILNTRRIEQSRPGNRADPFKIGLAIEGGGMRGVVSGGMVAALENLGLSKSFDAIYGSSAGSMAGAFLASGAAAQGCMVYHRYLNGSKFISISNIFKKKVVMDLDYLLDEVFCNLVPLDYAAVLHSPIPLKCVTTHAESAKTTLLQDYLTVHQIKKALKASACNPLIADIGVKIDNELYIDAAISEPIPVCSAVKDGCTHLLVLRTVSNAYRPKVSSIVNSHANQAIRFSG